MSPKCRNAKIHATTLRLIYIYIFRRESARMTSHRCRHTSCFITARYLFHADIETSPRRFFRAEASPSMRASHLARCSPMAGGRIGFARARPRRTTAASLRRTTITSGTWSPASRAVTSFATPISHGRTSASTVTPIYRHVTLPLASFIFGYFYRAGL